MKLFGRLLLAIGMFTLVSCSETTPQEIAVGKDQCENCKMTITEPKYATQLITQKGRLYKFDDISCMNDYETSNSEAIGAGKTYVADFPSGKFIEAKTATLIKGGQIKSPMGGNTQAYQDKATAEKAATELQATIQ
ncbi:MULTISPECIES: nitrous oxide reductase accessory protein NosL [unclassified Kaistella]|uniref:nitrous oxide reductase accessory protein NosL n=1 Tax=unclassified Kaistella TaxID=2762626 RepID=UPI00273427C0|nr:MULTISPECIES: nitrous oxide reductase accessory protein NosL [unclassified Kaistella]MCZ2083540.1 nitrous oxide reductase accessory protein NosL [Flavobacteriales bacterium]MDP2454172.1 nitrous oxide reductase accessory protein NosL [Kaistella sp. SH11-4b]MDP2457757.1 nitrous oxide reductase accessory protein NosL [Kaistella sp. SH40-3]MDP2460515.1 nitrous oxide reductase accessory protein NosL [Kaistella sp. SH19-2b]